MKSAIQAIAFATATLMWSSALSYDVNTHQQLSTDAGRQSVLNDSAQRARIGIGFPLENPGAQTFPNSNQRERTLLDLIGDGARFEDNSAKPLFHFFNPLTGNGLSLLANSPSWALEDKGTKIDQDYSFADARQAFFEALTEKDNQTRRTRFGRVFESLGHVIHHLQDMAQPQHVRNDPHLNLSWWQIAAICLQPLPIEVCSLVIQLRNPSAYEAYTEGIRDSLASSGYPSPYSNLDASTFRLPRQFWINEGMGIAEYTNRGFVSAGTNFHGTPGFIQPDTRFPLPDGISTRLEIATGEKLRLSLCPGGPLSFAVHDDDELWFIGTSVQDNYLHAKSDDPRTSTYSIFDADLEAHGKEKTFSLNRFNYCSAHNFLIPRAIGYSAGLINYFFRGDMEISLPSDGIFAIADTAKNGCGDPCGFGKLKLGLRNATPNDEMGAGQIRIVVKYHINNCYKPDLSGEYGGNAFGGNICRSPEEYIAVSLPQDILDGQVKRVGPTPLVFNFPPGSFVPVNATDIYLQVVFRGQLGQEMDAVAVSTLDIAEPNYLAMINSTDYVFDDSPGRLLYVPVSEFPGDHLVSIDHIRLSFAGSANPVATIDTLPGGGHAQVAFLGMPGPGTYTLKYDDSTYPTYDDQPFDMQQFTLDDGPPGAYSRTCPVYEVRKEFRQIALLFIQFPHGLSSWRSGGAKAALELGSHVDGTRVLGPKATAGDYCGFPSGGMRDTSTMSPQTPESATPWTITLGQPAPP